MPSDIADLNERRCKHCGKILCRREGEYLFNFRRRIYCDYVCSNKDLATPCPPELLAMLERGVSGLDRIVRELNELGVQPKRAKKWSKATVSRMLRRISLQNDYTREPGAWWKLSEPWPASLAFHDIDPGDARKGRLPPPVEIASYIGGSSSLCDTDTPALSRKIDR